MTEMQESIDCDRLFVYGTLRRGFRLHRRLARLGAVFCGEAMVAGELFDLGSFPGARPAEGEGKRVRGEVYQLSQPAQDLDVLDEVEGFNPRCAARSEFVRAIAEVTMRNGESCRAWIYWLGPVLRPMRCIASGDYAH